MKSHILAQQAVIITKTFRKAVGFGIQEDQVGIEGTGIEEDNRRMVLTDFFSQCIDNHDTGSFLLLLIINDRMNHCIILHSKVAGISRPRQGRSIAAEVASKRTASHTEVTVLAKSAPLFRIILIIPGDMGTTANDHISS